MTTQPTSKKLFITLTVSGLAFLLTGLTLKRFSAPPALTVLIDRSYCPSSQWQQVTRDYTELYKQHKRQQLQISAVVFFSDLSQTTADSVPTPDAIATLKTYGQPNAQSQRTLTQAYPHTQLLSCRSDQ